MSLIETGNSRRYSSESHEISHSSPRIVILTRRQVTILQGFVNGDTYKTLARKMHTSTRTVAKEASLIHNAFKVQTMEESIATSTAIGLIRKPDISSQLSGREQEIANLTGLGYTQAQIADILYISPRTVKRHLNNAYDKIPGTKKTLAAFSHTPIEPTIAIIVAGQRQPLTSTHGDVIQRLLAGYSQATITQEMKLQPEAIKDMLSEIRKSFTVPTGLQLVELAHKGESGVLALDTKIDEPTVSSQNTVMGEQKELVMHFVRFTRALQS